MVDIEVSLKKDYLAIRDHYLRHGDAFLLVYSITSRSSFEAIREYHREIQQQKPFTKTRVLPVVLVGNKSDLAADRIVSTQEAEALARELKAGFIETSAKKGTNLTEAFYEAVRRLRMQQQQQAEAETTSDGPLERKSPRFSLTNAGTRWKGRVSRIFGSSGKDSD